MTFFLTNKSRQKKGLQIFCTALSISFAKTRHECLKICLKKYLDNHGRAVSFSLMRYKSRNSSTLKKKKMKIFYPFDNSRIKLTCQCSTYLWPTSEKGGKIRNIFLKHFIHTVFTSMTVSSSSKSLIIGSAPRTYLMVKPLYLQKIQSCNKCFLTHSHLAMAH